MQGHALPSLQPHAVCGTFVLGFLLIEAHNRRYRDVGYSS